MTEQLPITKVDPDFAFIMFALTESGNAIRSIGELEQLFNVRDRVNDAVERRENASIFAKLRLVLTYSASVSRIFWPAKDSSKVRRRCNRLRNLVGIPDAHALSNRDLRNHIEHFDERLDSWLGVAPRPFTSFEIVVYKDLPEQTIEALQASVPVMFFENGHVIRLFNHEYNLADLRAALQDIRDRISGYFAQDGRIS